MTAGRLLQQFEQATAVHALQFHPSEMVLLSGGEDGNLLWWDLETNAQTCFGKRTLSAPIHQIEFLDDDQWVCRTSSGVVTDLSRGLSAAVPWASVVDCFVASGQLVLGQVMDAVVHTGMLDLEQQQGVRVDEREVVVKPLMPVARSVHETLSIKRDSPLKNSFPQRDVSSPMKKSPPTLKHPFAKSLDPVNPSHPANPPSINPQTNSSADPPLIDPALNLVTIKESDLLDDLQVRHEAWCGMLSSRLAHLRTLQESWNPSDATACLQASLTLGDVGAVADLVRIVMGSYPRYLTVTVGTQLTQCLLLLLSTQPLPHP